MTQLRSTMDAALEGRRLLQHPFYIRWTQGTLTLDELREYAAQYRSIEQAQPRWLAGIAAGLAAGRARESVERVLADELDTTATHADLFDRFATSVGAPLDAAATPATTRLMGTLDDLVERGTATGIGGLLAYELQSPDVSREKAAGLREHFGAGDDGVSFWETHAALDVHHAEWLLGALSADPAALPSAVDAARDAAAAWWAFLDERDAAAA